MKKINLLFLAGALVLFTLNSCGDDPLAQYKITFNYQDGVTTSQTIQVEEGHWVVKPPNPERQGYIFGGWYTEPEYNIAFDFTSTKVSSSFTLYAKWSEPAPATEYKTLSVSPDGTVWIGTDQYLYSKLPGGELEQHTNAVLPIVGMALYTATTPGQMILATTQGAINYTFNSNTLAGETVWKADKAISTVAIDANTRWIATSDSLLVFKSNDAWASMAGERMNIKYKDGDQKYVIENNSAASIVLNNNTAYMIMQNNGNRAVERFVKGVDGITGASPYEKWGPCIVEKVLCIAIAENGEQWLGSEKGLFWHENSEFFAYWLLYTTAHGLPDDRVQAIAIANGYIWAGTQQGISRVTWNASSKSIEVKNYSANDGSGSGIIGIAAGHENTIYAITSKTLYAISGDAITTVARIGN